MNKVVVRKNIWHFHERLETEACPVSRSVLHRLLIIEGDALGRNSEMLHKIETQIANGKKRVSMQQALIVSLERDGHDTTQALALLNRLSETLLIYENHRQSILIALNESRL